MFILAGGGWCHSGHAQVINEVLPSQGDRVEIYAAANGPVDLNGLRLCSGAFCHVIDSTWFLAPGEHAVIAFVGDNAIGAAQASSRLPREGGSLLLLAADGATILDVFNWPSLERGWSYGRVPDGGCKAMPSPSPSIGSPDRSTPDGPRHARGDDPGSAYIDLAGEREMHLSIDPLDLWDPARGIDVEGLHDNYSKSGPQWQRPAVLSTHRHPGAKVTLRIAGSGSRSLPKRSFHAHFNAGGAIVHGDTCNAVTLRADASPHAFLRNVLLTEVAERADCAVDVQPYVAVRLAINGRSHGAYRVLPKKNRRWVRQFAQGPDIDMLAGPHFDVVHGDRVHFDHAWSKLMANAPFDSLEQWIDMRSLIDLACLDLYAGRADHDLNVRCWKPRTPEGRWRWILYDMDLWAPVRENSVERMLSGDALEAPFIPAIFANAQVRDVLLARMVALVNTVLSPDRAPALLDSLFDRHQALLWEDHERWQGVLQRPDPAHCRIELETFLRDRPAVLLDHLAATIGTGCFAPIVRCEPSQAGWVELEGLYLTDGCALVRGLGGTPMHMTAYARPGYEFVGWSDEHGDTIPAIPMDPALHREVIASFRPVAWSGRNGLKQTVE